MAIDLDVIQSKEEMWREIQYPLTMLSNEIAVAIGDIMMSDEVRSARWLMVHLDRDNCLVEIVLGIHAFEIYPSKFNQVFEVFEVDGVKGKTEIFKSNYRRLLFARLNKLLRKMGFETIDPETPFEEGNEHTGEKWHVLELPQ